LYRYITWMYIYGFRSLTNLYTTLFKKKQFIHYTTMCPLIFYFMFVHSINIVIIWSKDIKKKKLCWSFFITAKLEFSFKFFFKILISIPILLQYIELQPLQDGHPTTASGAPNHYARSRSADLSSSRVKQCPSSNPLMWSEEVRKRRKKKDLDTVCVGLVKSLWYCATSYHLYMTWTSKVYAFKQ
jgi:hypothetical protein